MRYQLPNTDHPFLSFLKFTLFNISAFKLKHDAPWGRRFRRGGHWQLLGGWLLRAAACGASARAATTAAGHVEAAVTAVAGRSHRGRRPAQPLSVHHSQMEASNVDPWRNRKPSLSRRTTPPTKSRSWNTKERSLVKSYYHPTKKYCLCKLPTIHFL